MFSKKIKLPLAMRTLSAAVLAAALLLCNGAAATQADTQDSTSAIPQSVTPPPATAIPADWVPAQAAAGTVPEKILHIALLLPTRSENLATAAQALRAGVMAAYERDGDGISIQLIETDDVVADILAAYQAASGEYDLIIGPLARSAVMALAQSKDISKPTLLLGQPENSALPPNLLPIGLSIEDEARQLANWAAGDKNSVKSAGKLLVVSTNAAWQRRAARSFASQWPGLDASVLELAASGGYLSASGVRQLKNKIAGDKPNVLFIALDADQTRQIRPLLPADARIYGSSQLNEGKSSSPGAETDAMELPPLPEGIRLLDLPWQLQPDHSAVMVYPRLVAEPKPGADMERLYALGIDAFRIAREIGVNHQSRFSVDGVTGRLTIQFGKGSAHFERMETAAIVRGGSLQLLQRNP